MKAFSLVLITFLFVLIHPQGVRAESGIGNTSVVLQKKHKKVNIDSLYQVVLLRKDDTIKVNKLIDVYRKSIRNRPIRHDILDEALKLSEKLNYATGIANCLNLKGLNARYRHEYLQSVKLHKEANKFYKNSWDKHSYVKNLNNLGVSYRKLNLEEPALEHYFEALRLSEDFKDTKSMAIALNGIGNAFINQKQYDEAKKYFELALKLEQLNKNDRGMGYDYSNLGEVFMYKKMYDSSYAYHIKSLEIARKLKNKENEAIIYNNIAKMFQQKGSYEESLKYYRKALPDLEKFRSKRYLSNTLINIGKDEIALKQYKDAEANIRRGLDIALKIGSKENIILGYDALSELYEATGKYRKSLEEYKNMIVYKDSMFDMQSKQHMDAMEIRYESEKKDQQIRQLNLQNKVQRSRNIIQWLVIGLMLVLVLFSVFYTRLRLRNNQLELEEMRNNIEEYIAHISKLENEDCGKKQVDLTEKIEKYGLSNREAEVLKYIASGLKNQEIADKMFVSLSTVKTHTKNIFEKMDVRNRIEAVRKAQAL